MPEELQESILMYTAVGRWSDKHNADLGTVVDELAHVCPRWDRILNGRWFTEHLVAAVETIVRKGSVFSFLDVIC